MVQTQTILNTADNSGAKKIMCIKVLGDSRRRYARVGDIISASVKTAIPGGNVKKGDVVNFSVIECNSEYKRIVVSHLATYSKRKEIIKVKKEKVDKSTLGDLDVLVDLKKKMDDEI